MFKLIVYRKVIASGIKSFFLWPVYLISYLFPRSNNIILFGCHLDSPAGNILNFFYDCSNAYREKNKKIIWISKNERTYQFIKKNNFQVVRKKSLKGIWFCLRARFYCYSSYFSDISYFLSGGAKGINLWHGTPLKKIERDISTGPYAKRYKYKFIFQYLQPWVFKKSFKMFASSKYEIKCFKSAFDLEDKDFYISYPPRLKAMSSTSSSNIKRILLLPTFRDSTKQDYRKTWSLNELNSFGIEKSVDFLIKLHPADISDDPDVLDLKKVNCVERLQDVYELFSQVDLVITDYSSIFFDCIYLRKPFLLFWPDLKFYNSQCRGFYFSPQELLNDFAAYEINTLIEKILENNSENKIDLKLDEIFKCFPLSADYPFDVFEKDDKK